MTDIHTVEDLERLAQSFRVQASVKNSTTKKELREKDQARVSVAELLEDPVGVVLEIPGPFGGTGHTLVVHLRVLRGDEELHPEPFVFTGKIEQLQVLQDDLERIKLPFINVDRDQWDAFLRIFSQRQEEISLFLEQVKG